MLTQLTTVIVLLSYLLLFSTKIYGLIYFFTSFFSNFLVTYFFSCYYCIKKYNLGGFTYALCQYQIKNRT